MSPWACQIFNEQNNFLVAKTIYQSTQAFKWRRMKPDAKLNERPEPAHQLDADAGTMSEQTLPKDNDASFDKTKDFSGQPTKFVKERISVHKRQYQVFDNPQLSIFNLMAITAICALTITLVTAVGFFGAHVLFIACGIANLMLVERLSDRPELFRFWNQFSWLVLLPLGCIFADPFVFGYFELGKVVYITTYGIGCYAFIGWQIAVVAVSWYAPREKVFLNHFLGGSMVAAGTFAFIVGILILPMTVIGTLFLGAGLPGFAPWITGMVFFKSASWHFHRPDTQNVSGIPIAVGFILAVGIGLAAYALAVQFDLSIDRPEWLSNF